MRHLQRRASSTDATIGGSSEVAVPGKSTLTDQLQMRPAGAIQAKGNVSFGVNLQSTGGGDKLPDEVRSKMEAAHGASFNDVRVHTDGQAEQFGALAFTTGNNIHFAQGKYDPASPAGQELLGHELAHVVQQRAGRVSAPDVDGNAAVVQDAALEAEADAMGARAAAFEAPRTGAASKGGATSAAGGRVQAKMEDGHEADGIVQAKADGALIQQKPVLQGMLPAALAGVGSALAAMSTADSIALAGAVLSGVALAGQAGAAIAPGSTGVQTLQLEAWTTEQDKHRLERITQVRLINAYVEQWKRAHPDQAVTSTADTSTTTTTTTTGRPTRSGGSTSTTSTTTRTTDTGGPAAAGSQIESTIMDAVKTTVQSELTSALNRGQRSANSQEYIWSDSGEHTADWFGTVGAIQFRDVRGSRYSETLRLSADAAQIQGLSSIPGLGETMDVRQFRGGRLVRGASMETGLNDDLAINVVGGAETKDEAANNEHGKVTVATEWTWDDNATQMELDIDIDSAGRPTFHSPQWSGTPED